MNSKSNAVSSPRSLSSLVTIPLGLLVFASCALIVGCSAGQPDRDNHNAPESSEGETEGDASIAPQGDASIAPQGDEPSEPARDSQGDIVIDASSFSTDEVTEPGAGCNKVDFLFVIDNSISMEEEQNALLGSFDGFIDTIQTTLPTKDDFHIMVVDTDAQTKCVPNEDGTRCRTYDSFHDLCGGSATTAYACTYDFDACDMVLGAGVDHPVGKEASNRECIFEGGNRYILGSDPHLNENFKCAAQVGLAGHAGERPIDAMLAALPEDINAPLGCNDGFLRDDAILVVTFISDDIRREDGRREPDGSALPESEFTEPPDWYASLLAAKHNDPTAIVMLGFFPEKQAHWTEFVGLFGEQARLGPVLPDNVVDGAQIYSDFFKETVGLIDATCEDFVPPVVR